MAPGTWAGMAALYRTVPPSDGLVVSVAAPLFVAACFTVPFWHGLLDVHRPSLRMLIFVALSLLGFLDAG